MIGVSQANRILEFIEIIQDKGARECKDRRSAGSRCFTNPYNTTGDGVPYLFITRKFEIRFGHILTTASRMADHRVTQIINEGRQARNGRT